MTDNITLPRSVIEQALEALNASMPHNNDMCEDWPSHIAARRALRAALKQPQVEQEPVAYATHDAEGSPSMLFFDRREAESYCDDGEEPTPLYTHPQNLNCKSNQARLATLWGYEKPQPPRQPLTEEQIRSLFTQDIAYGRLLKLIRIVEAAHRIGGEA